MHNDYWKIPLSCKYWLLLSRKFGLRPIPQHLLNMMLKIDLFYNSIAPDQCNSYPDELLKTHTQVHVLLKQFSPSPLVMYPVVRWCMARYGCCMHACMHC